MLMTKHKNNNLDTFNQVKSNYKQKIIDYRDAFKVFVFLIFVTGG